MAGRLQNKIAVVTGGASGIGEGIVRRFCAEGATVLVADVDETGGAAVALECGAEFVRLDVSSEQAWSALAEKVRADYGHLDVMINNAGIVSNADIMTVDVATWNQQDYLALAQWRFGSRASFR